VLSETLIKEVISLKMFKSFAKIKKSFDCSMNL